MKHLFPSSMPGKFAGTLATMVLTAMVIAWLPGCGSGTPEFHQDVRDTPASLAEEFVFRYKGLPEQASARSIAKAEAVEKAKAALPDVDAETKSSHAEALTKKAAVPTLGGLLDDLDARLGKLTGTARSDAAKAVLDILDKESAIREADREAITKRLKSQ